MRSLILVFIVTTCQKVSFLRTLLVHIFIRSWLCWRSMLQQYENDVKYSIVTGAITFGSVDKYNRLREIFYLG